jgi:hypothetical protein
LVVAVAVEVLYQMVVVVEVHMQNLHQLQV